MRDVVFIALVWTVTSRIAELVWSRRTAARLRARGGTVAPDDGFRMIAVVHGLWIAGIAIEESTLGPVDLGWLHPVALAAFVLAELLRAWCILTLGDRWNVRVLTVPGESSVRRGPYRLLSHPNYVAVVVGLVALPLALGLPLIAAAVLPLKLASLRRRLRVENAALSRAAAGGAGSAP